MSSWVFLYITLLPTHIPRDPPRSTGQWWWCHLVRWLNNCVFHCDWRSANSCIYIQVCLQDSLLLLAWYSQTQPEGSLVNQKWGLLYCLTPAMCAEIVATIEQRGRSTPSPLWLERLVQLLGWLHVQSLWELQLHMGSYQPMFFSYMLKSLQIDSSPYWHKWS